jgi:hypothetical protein
MARHEHRCAGQTPDRGPHTPPLALSASRRIAAVALSPASPPPTRRRLHPPSSPRPSPASLRLQPPPLSPSPSAQLGRRCTHHGTRLPRGAAVPCRPPMTLSPLPPLHEQSVGLGRARTGVVPGQEQVPQVLIVPVPPVPVPCAQHAVSVKARTPHRPARRPAPAGAHRARLRTRPSRPQPDPSLPGRRRSFRCYWAAGAPLMSRNLPGSVSPPARRAALYLGCTAPPRAARPSCPAPPAATTANLQRVSAEAAAVAAADHAPACRGHSHALRRPRAAGCGGERQGGGRRRRRRRRESAAGTPGHRPRRSAPLTGPNPPPLPHSLRPLRCSLAPHLRHRPRCAAGCCCRRHLCLDGRLARGGQECVRRRRRGPKAPPGCRSAIYYAKWCDEESYAHR